MSRIFDNFEVAKRALVTQQSVLQTIGHNLANASTPGYTRQRAELAPVRVQNGVEVTAIIRIRDRYLDFSVMAESQTLAQDQARQGALQRLQAALSDPPDTGLSTMLDRFFQGFEALAADPTNQALRVTLQDSGAHLAATFQGLQARLDQLKSDFTTQIHQQVGEANGLIGQVAELNRQIRASGGGPTPNDLLDKRDQLIDKLNVIVGVTATDRGDGTVQLAVTGSGVLVVDGSSTLTLTATLDSGADRVDLAAGGIAVTPTGGALAAVLEVRNSPTGPVKQAAADLDSLARSIIAEVNGLHASGAGLTGHTVLTSLATVTSGAVPLDAAGLPTAPGSGSFEVVVHDDTGAVVSRVTVPVTAGVTTLDDVAAAIDADPELSASVTGGALEITAASGRSFALARDTSGTLAALGMNVFFAGSSARDIALAPAVAADADLIAAGQADAAGLVHPGDGSTAQAIARLRAALAMNGGTATFSDFLGTVIGRAGSQAREANDAVDRQGAAVAVVQNLQQQTSGVSVDEEMIGLTQSQYAYAAAARYMTTVQDMIDSLFTMMSA